MKEARARIKINKALEASGWRFFDEPDGPANIVLEPKVKLTTAEIDALGEDFEHTTNGFIDFLLLDESGRPFVVLEAKAENRDPLVGKEQARKYVRAKQSQEWINHVINALRERILALGSGSTFPNINIKDIVALSVPLPPSETQLEIVAELKSERALVDANRELIGRMEKKIKAAIERVWGATELSEAPETLAAE